jgi:hypothetical protein
MTASLDGFVADRHGSATRLSPDLADLQGTDYMDAAIERGRRIRGQTGKDRRLPRRDQIVNVPDPDGNAIACAEPPDAASPSPRSTGPRA